MISTARRSGFLVLRGATDFVSGQACRRTATGPRKCATGWLRMAPPGRAASSWSTIAGAEGDRRLRLRLLDYSGLTCCGKEPPLHGFPPLSTSVINLQRKISRATWTRDVKACFPPLWRPGRPRVWQLPDPAPAADEVLVAVHAASVNAADWKMRAGQYGASNFVSACSGATFRAL